MWPIYPKVIVVQWDLCLFIFLFWTFIVFSLSSTIEQPLVSLSCPFFVFNIHKSYLMNHFLDSGVLKKRVFDSLDESVAFGSTYEMWITLGKGSDFTSLVVMVFCLYSMAAKKDKKRGEYEEKRTKSEMLWIYYNKI